MADSDKDIRITPNTSKTAQPETKFVGKDNVAMYLKVLDNGSLSYESTEGQVFSITPTLSSGDIFSVNDISGLQSMAVHSDGTVKLAPFGGNVGIGTTSPSTPLHVRTTTTSLDNVLLLENNGGSGSPGVGIKMFSNVGTQNYLEILHDAFGHTNFKTVNGSSTYSQQLYLQNDGKVSFGTGNVGIGNTNPSAPLTITADTDGGDTVRIEGLDSNANLTTPDLALIRTNGSPAGNTWLGHIHFKGMNNASGTNEEISYASIAGQVDAGTDGSEKGRLKFFTMVSGTNTQVLTIDEDNVGIGTGEPDRHLHVDAGTENLGGIKITSGGANASLTLENDGTNGGKYRMSVSSGSHADGVNKLLIQDNNTTRITLISSGNVGINDTTPSYKLDVAGTLRATGTITGGADITANLHTIGTTDGFTMGEAEPTGYNTGVLWESAYTCSFGHRFPQPGDIPNGQWNTLLTINYGDNSSLNHTFTSAEFFWTVNGGISSGSNIPSFARSGRLRALVDSGGNIAFHTYGDLFVGGTQTSTNLNQIRVRAVKATVGSNSYMLFQFQNNTGSTMESDATDVRVSAKLHYLQAIQS